MDLLAVLVYFIHHIAKSIQLPEVIASIARDLDSGHRCRVSRAGQQKVTADGEPSSAVTADLLEKLGVRGAEVTAKHSGYLQFVSYGQLVDIAEGTWTR